MKRVCIKIAGSEREPIDTEIRPGTTPAQLLADLNLEDCCLHPRNSGRFLREWENLFTVLEDGDLLYAVTVNSSTC